MRLTRRVQVLMTPDDYKRLSEVARRKQASVGELMRSAAVEKFLAHGDHAHLVVEDIATMELPVDDWGTMKDELLEGADERLP